MLDLQDLRVMLCLAHLAHSALLEKVNLAQQVLMSPVLQQDSGLVLLMVTLQDLVAIMVCLALLVQHEVTPRALMGSLASLGLAHQDSLLMG